MVFWQKDGYTYNSEAGPNSLIHFSTANFSQATLLLNRRLSESHFLREENLWEF